MKTFYTKLILILFFVLTCFGASSQNKKMPVTSTSSKAISLYQQSLDMMANADFSPATDLLKKALKEDPNFFLAQSQLASLSQSTGKPNEYRKYADMIKGNQSKLSEAEMLIKSAFMKMEADPKANNIDTGEKLVKMYPKDSEPYYYLTYFQIDQGKFGDAVATLKKMLEFTDSPAPVYNQLGYSYMGMKDFANAEKSFDKYIQLVPNHPNPYDSKGDYYMRIKDYANAYRSYMNAYDLNANWSYDKAQKAKNLMEMADSGVIDSKSLQGAWQLVGGWWVDDQGKKMEYTGPAFFDQIKIWSGNHFICVGKYKNGDQFQNNFACGTFTLGGKKYGEDIQYHATKSAVGSKVNMSMEVKGDTLIQSWPVDDSGKIDNYLSSGEKYVRIK